MTTYEDMIEFMDSHGFIYRLPKITDIDKNDMFDRVLCFGSVNENPPDVHDMNDYIYRVNCRHSYTRDIFKIIIERLEYKDPRGKYIPEATRLIKQYYDIKVIFDCDHSRIEYSDALVEMKEDLLKDVILILTHYYPKDESKIKAIDYIMDYSPKFLLDTGIVPLKYAHKLLVFNFWTSLEKPIEYNSLNSEIQKIIHKKYILAGGQNRRDYRALAQVCNNLRIQLVICDTEHLTKHEIENTRYVTKLNVDMAEFDMLVRHCMFLVIPIKEEIPAPVGITVIVKGNIANKICISTTGAGVDEYIHHGVNGLIVDNNEQSLEKSIRYVMNPNTRKKMENNIDKHRFTSDGIREKIIEMFNSIFENM